MIWIVALIVVFAVITDALSKLRLKPYLAADVSSEAQGSRSHVTVRTESRLSGSHADLPSGGYEYEVFLSFRGSDTRKGFTDCLYCALREDARVRTFRDDEDLQPGDEIGGKLLKAIAESKICIPIFSQNYASSKWCLKELAFMLECKKEGNHMILPVFYHVTPTEVQDQTGDYGRAMRKHEKKYDAEIVQQWREALSEVGHLKGMDLVNLANGYEGQLIKLIVLKVLRELKKAQLNVTDNLVGIDDHVEAVTQLVQLGAPEGYEFEVFLNFRGSDTHKGFTDCLYHALLDNARIRTFRDDEELRPGEEIGGKLLKAIAESKIYIPIFSKNYASSKWCLKELTFMLERKKAEGNHMILPVFYDITQSEVQDQTGDYGRALRKHEKKFGAKIVQQWREALSEVGHLKGMDLVNLANGYEGNLIKLIVLKVLRELKKAQLNVTDNLVGIDDHVEAVTQLLQLGAPEVRIIGLWGMGGIGKTTLSKVIYNQIWGEFEGYSFIGDVRETSGRNGLKYLQSSLVANLLRCAQPHFESVDKGIHELKDTYRRKKVLILLDDIDDTKQLDALVIRHDSFLPGSRIILTTRNRYVLDRHQVDHIYEVEAMNQDAALKLFCKHAFRKDTPTDEFSGLSDDIVKTTGGLPLALEVIGSSLSSKGKVIWKGMLEKLRIIPNKDVHENLRISFEELDYVQKQIFLDIACFFIGDDMSKIFPVWEDCSFSPRVAISDLVAKSLIKIGDDNEIWMHNQLRDLGREIVRQESNKEPGRRSRLWCNDEAQIVLEDYLGTKNVKAIHLDNELWSNPYVISGDQFRVLPNLQYLDLADASVAGDCHGLLSNLRWLGWHFRTKFNVPPGLHGENLVVLDLSRSAVDETWNGWGLLQEAKRLAVLDLSSCHHLKRTPDFSSFQSMERLILRNCIILDTIDPSVGHLRKLTSLDVRNCVRLKSLPKGLGSLTQLFLEGTSIEEIPIDSVDSTNVSSGAQGSRSHGALLLPLNPQLVVEPELVAVRTESQLSGSHDDLPSGGYDFEVFLSFRGTDTCKGFTNFLYHALHEDAGVRTFRDDEELLKAIAESKIYIPIFSQNYASSKWCLKVLSFMLECKKEGNHMILPVFYDVTPTEVQDQTWDYGRALRKHEKNFGAKIVQQWREALSEVGHLKGMDLVNLANGCEGDLIKLIVLKVLRELKKAQLNVTDNLAGIDDHVEAVTQLLQFGAPEVRIIGLWGMGGTGKTTLSKVIYNQIYADFEGYSFIGDVRETSERNGLTYLQSSLVADLSRCAHPHFASVYEGIRGLKYMYCHKKVLILLDDIDDKQLDALVIRHDSFGPGSRVILTTRNRYVLDRHQVDHIYEVEAMNQDAALKLFCKHAFRKDTPTDEFSGLSDEIVKTTGGLPLALEVIGSSLSSKRKAIWEVTLEKLRIIPNKYVHEKLRISFEALDDWQKQIFLDIACFFIGYDIIDALPMWKDCYLFSPEAEIHALVVQSLIKIEVDGKTVWMHEQLRDLGREIVRQEDYKEPGRRSRLWDIDDAQNVLTNQMGSSNVEAIRVHGRRQHFTSEQFRNLSNLRFLDLGDDVSLAGDFGNLLPSLRWLRWKSSSFNSLNNFHLLNLVSLELPRNNLKDDVWKGFGPVQMIKLKVLDLRQSQNLTRTPDFSTFPNLERFIMSECYQLRVIDPSISNLKKLTYLDISSCGRFGKLSSLSNLTLLKTLKACNCSQLQELAGLDQLYALKSLDIRNCHSIKRLPDLSKLQKMEVLDASNCRELQELVGLDELTSLKMLGIANSKQLKELPDLSKLKKLETLTEMDVRSSKKLWD